MTIDGTDISTFGLRFLTIDDGLFSKPARKKILSNPGFLANDITFEEQTTKVTLFGEYADQPTMLTNIENFKTLVKSDVNHTFYIPDYEFTFTGVIKQGIKVDPIRNVTTVSFIINITE